MSNPNHHDHHQTVGYFGMENWRKVLNINSKKVLNCSCRGNKSDYKKTQSLLYHFEKNHPEHYDEIKRELRQKRTLR
ncbi:hypothetical protein BD770DRAFT_399676 [Pilaira anomala]|nr:hypothetical protein BD770DRAFT_399676 [Pilaira anomala]